MSKTIDDLRVNERIVVYCIDNSDGQCDLVYKIAYKDEKGELMDHETNYPILEYVGDKIIEWWLLTPGSGLTWQEK